LTARYRINPITESATRKTIDHYIGGAASDDTFQDGQTFNARGFHIKKEYAVEAIENAIA
jgi:hypothetical protein